MYGVVIHDYMRDTIDKEFLFAYGTTKSKAIESAWTKLKNEAGNLIDEMKFDDGTHVTKTLFKNSLLNDEFSSDAIFIARPYYLYAKLFKIPKSMM